MAIAELSKKLLESGLEERQSKVYAASLMLGPDTVQHIAEQSGVKRATTYLVIDELMDMGLVFESRRGKKKLIVAKSPEMIKQNLELAEAEIQKQKENFKNNLSDIKSMSRISTAPSIRYYSGKNATSTINAYLTRKASRNELVYSMGDSDEVLKADPDIVKKGVERRKKKNIKTKVIYSGSIDMPNNKDGRQSIRSDSKILGSLQIQKEVMTVMTNEGPDSVAIVIEGEKIVAPLRQLYEMAWEGQELKKKAAEYKNK
jgi:sugar-specific transcriptional regulator TrmB